MGESAPSLVLNRTFHLLQVKVIWDATIHFSQITKHAEQSDCQTLTQI